MEETTHREYLLWVAYFNEEWNRQTKQDWYLAQIAREVSCVLEDTEGRKKKTIKSFLIDFVFSTPKSKEEESKSAWERSKAIWTSAINLKGQTSGKRNRETSRPIGRRS